MWRVLLDVAPRPKESGNDNTTMVIVMCIVAVVMLVTCVLIPCILRIKKSKAAKKEKIEDKKAEELNG